MGDESNLHEYVILHLGAPQRVAASFAVAAATAAAAATGTAAAPAAAAAGLHQRDRRRLLHEASLEGRIEDYSADARDSSSPWLNKDEVMVIQGKQLRCMAS